MEMTVANSHQASHVRCPRLGLDSLVGDSQVMRDVFDQVRRAAQCDSTVVVSGESGTGKELVAEALHKLGPRSGGPFITVNMAAIPDTLVESELFGHVKGAFTGSTIDRIGRFEAADGGSLFVDEIGDFNLALQAKLLRVLESRHLTPVGGNSERRIDVRVIAATNCSLEAMTIAKTFRLDLYYRLNVVTIFVPPLRARRSDIPLLIEHFLDQLCEPLGRPRPQFDVELTHFLQTYYWPGNIRQLRNCLESMVVMAKSPVVNRDDLPERMFVMQQRQNGDWEVPADMTLEQLEKKAITQALKRFRGSRSEAARSLGISIRTLQRKLRLWDQEEKHCPALPR